MIFIQILPNSAFIFFFANQNRFDSLYGYFFSLSLSFCSLRYQICTLSFLHVLPVLFLKIVFRVVYTIEYVSKWVFLEYSRHFGISGILKYDLEKHNLWYWYVCAVT